MDKTRRFRRSTPNFHQQMSSDIQQDMQSKSDEDDDDDDDDQHQDDHHEQFNEHFTQKENNLNTLRQNFKCVQQHTSSGTLFKRINNIVIERKIKRNSNF